MKDYIKQLFENAGVNLPNENSLGEKIIPDDDPEKIANFWNWFGNSKIVDEQGRPLVVYHGTQAEFNSFKPAKRGIYFASLKRKEEVAGYYAQDKGRILACYLKIENPFIGNPTEVYKIKEKKENNEKINCDGLISINDFKKNNKFYNYQTDKLEEITLEIGDIVEIVAFEPNQIKAVNNNGLFSSASNNIYESIEYAEMLDDGNMFENVGVNLPNENSLGEKIIPDDDPVKLQNFWNWFGGSKVIDDQGRPKVMYHGTPNAIYDTLKAGTYFTEKKSYADVYQSQGASSISYKREAKKPFTYSVYLKMKNPFDTRTQKCRKIFYDYYYLKMGSGTDLQDNGLPDWVDGEDLVEFLREHPEFGYDGLLLDEGGVGGYGEDVVYRGVSYITLYPNQAKVISNTSFTDSDSIYESIEFICEDKKYQLNDNFWNWFGDSKTIRGGSPMIFYHGTPNEFSVFDINKSSPYGNVGRGFYFTDTFETAQNYIGGLLGRKTEKSHVKECYLRMENPYDLDEIITDNEILSLANLIENNNDSFWFNKILEDINYRYSRKSLPAGWDFDEGMLVPFDRITKDGLSDAITWLYNKKILMTNQLTRDNVWFVVTDGYHTNKSKEYLKEWLFENGYDSVIFDIVGDNKGNGTYTNKCYVVFNSKQIKSVDNKGLYSIENDDIYESIEYAEMLDDGNMFEVHKNPTDKEFWDLMRNSHSKMLRVFVGDKDCYVWDGYDRTHDEIDFHFNDYFSNHAYEYAQVYCYPTWITESEFNKHHLYHWFVEKYYADVTFKEPEKKPAYELQDKPNDNINWDEVFNELEELDNSLLKKDIK